jgi:ATP-dependent DNA helicase RecG
MLGTISGVMSRAEIQAALGLKGRANFEERYLKPAIEMELIDMTRPDRPRSSSNGTVSPLLVSRCLKIR